MGWFDDMGSGFESFISDVLRGLEDNFSTCWDETENAMEDYLNGFGENIARGASAYKDLVVSEYKAGLNSIKNDYQACYRKIQDKRRSAKEEKAKKELDRGTNELASKRRDKEKQLERLKEARLRRFERAKANYQRKLAK